MSEAGRAELSAIPWLQIVGMRNRLLHAYFDINLDIRWDRVQVALPGRIDQLKASLGTE